PQEARAGRKGPAAVFARNGRDVLQGRPGRGLLHCSTSPGPTQDIGPAFAHRLRSPISLARESGSQQRQLDLPERLRIQISKHEPDVRQLLDIVQQRGHHPGHVLIYAPSGWRYTTSFGDVERFYWRDP